MPTLLTVDDIDAYSVSELVAILQEADEKYHNGSEPIMGDADYDFVYKYLQTADPDNPYFGLVGSQVRGGKVDLPSPMGSLDQVYTGDTVKWIARNKLQKDQMVISDKLDGASVLIVYGRSGKFEVGFSRGDGYQGADITRHLSKMPGVPKTIPSTGEPVMIRAENIISPANFRLINSGQYSRNGRIYKNPRNMVSGQMNASEVHQEILNIIDSVAYEVVGSTMSKLEQLEFLRAAGFKVVVHDIFPAATLEDSTLSEILGVRRSNSEYEIDGLVIDVDSAVSRKRLNNNDLNPPHAVKFKIADVNNSAVTEVLNVEWNLSKDGYFKPRVQFKPVQLVGVTIQNATGFNAKFIKVNSIGPGAMVRIVRSGDVIPFIEAVVSPSPAGAQMPAEAGHWTESGVDFVIDDAHANDTVAFEELKEFFHTMDVDYLGEGNLKPMFEAGFVKPEMIIPMTQEDFASVLGSTAIGKKIFAGMKKSFINVPLYKLMGAHPSMGRGVGERKMKKLYEAWNGDMSKCDDMDAIVAVAGFDKKTAAKIVAGYKRFNEFFAAIKPYITVAPFEAKKQGKLSASVFVFTGFRSADLEAKIVDRGGSIGSTVSSKTTYLVTAEENSTSAKAVKARSAGVEVISLNKLKEMLE